ncbi:cAMP-binding domain of CRP or a regulatory subunit of cAMP-dependent protein kinases [Lentzea xinjiangensis]|uniref:cAMP-binding domain of CRP or a regulatory subunit of cAMP-dependent protein kinases n=1 Tax=Lentzea xinjiangensis TaxID=402600 RepID=A0A1H9J0A6_9PSEU|nr:Crp/Fnr family transcriptional regulator [Lentzea xinjiangensis]SEQ80199.1 cAMP-binding domain of CRP or a regulatory subunit of cAMP-dependent protein kinases [Lentzea xinjiangensis]
MGIGHSFWGMLEPADRTALQAAATRVAFGPGSVICHQGDESRNVLVVSRGRVRVSRFSPSGEEAVLAVRGPGEIIGELAAIDGRCRSATLTAVDRVEGVMIAAGSLKRLCTAHPGIAWAMLRVVVARQRDASQQQDLRTGPSLHRVGAVLLDLAHRGANDMITTVPLSQRELAGIAGISRETLARALKTLRDAEIIATSRTSIEILREDELRSLCGI